MRADFLRRRLLSTSVLAVLGVTLAACLVGPDFHEPAAPAEDHYASGADPRATVAANGVAQRFASGHGMTSDWWTMFQSAALDAVVKEAMDGNPGLVAAQASLRQSQEQLRAGYGIFYPAVQGRYDASRERYSPEAAGLNAPASIFNLFTLSATVSYTLDIFRGERRTVEGLAAQTEQQRDVARGTWLALSANVVNAFIAKAAYEAEIDVTRKLIDLEKDQVRLAEVQATAGTGPYSAALSLKSQLATTEATLPPLQQKIAQTDDLLATLVGRTPASWSPPAVRFADLALPQELPVSLPSELVRQRPDVLAAEASAHAASAEIGVATAALLPSLTLNASYGLNNTQSNSLFAANSRFGSVGAGLATPIIEGGTLLHERRAAIAGYDAAMAQYRQTVLAAFAQVADTLRALEHDAETARDDDEALAAADQALHLVHADFDAGLATYTDVLVADAQFHQAEIAKLQTLALRYQDTVALFTALGGGWWAKPVAADLAP
jgi:NodT family efflux transporter outer membrane factor (OMF) lipoprotein